MKKGVLIVSSFVLIALLGFFVLNLLLPQNVLGQYKTMDLARASKQDTYKDATLLCSEPYESRYYDFLIKKDWLHIVPMREHVSVLGSKYSITTRRGTKLDTKLKNMAAHFDEYGELAWDSADTIPSSDDSVLWCILPASYTVDAETEGLSSVTFLHNEQSYILYLKK